MKHVYDLNASGHQTHYTHFVPAVSRAELARRMRLSFDLTSAIRRTLQRTYLDRNGHESIRQHNSPMKDLQNGRKLKVWKEVKSLASPPVITLVPKAKPASRIPPHLIVTASAWIGRLVNMVVQITSVRLLLSGLGSDHYAVYALLTSLLGWYLLADIGLGFSIQNYVSECRAEDRDYRDYLGAAVMSCTVLMVLGVAVICLASPFLGPLLLRHYLFLNPAEMSRSFLVVSLFFVLTGVTSLGPKVWYAFQKGYLPNLITPVASVLTLLGLIWSTQLAPSSRLFWSLAASVVPPAIAAIVTIGWLIVQEHPSWRLDWDLQRSLWKRAVSFWIVSLLGIAVLQVDYLIIAQVLPSRDLVIYNLAAKLFAVAYTLYVVALQALWPVSAELVARQQWDQVLAHVRQYLFVGLVFMAAVTLLFMVAEKPILTVLSPKEHITIPLWFIALYGLYQIIGVWTGTYAIVLQSKNDLRPFVIWGAVQAVVCAPLQWLLAVHFGLGGILLGLIASYLLTSAWVLPLRVRQHVRDHKAAQASGTHVN